MVNMVKSDAKQINLAYRGEPSANKSCSFGGDKFNLPFWL